MNPLETQVGGTHYLDAEIQPADIVNAFGLDFFIGNALYMILRQKGNPVEDKKKAIQWIELWLKYNKPDTPKPQVTLRSEQVEEPTECKVNGNGRPFIHVLRACCNTHELDSERHTVADLLHALHQGEHHDHARTVLGMIGTNNLTDSVKLGPFFRLITEGQIECLSCS